MKMIEIIDNAIQLMSLSVCFIYAAILYIRTKEQVWFLLSCFYSAFALGLAHWLLFLVLCSKSPKISPVSDLSWLAAISFLLLLQNVLSLPGESQYRPLLAWLAPAFSWIMCLFFFRWGHYFINILWAGLMGPCGYFALRGWLFGLRKSDVVHNHQHFHMSVMAFFLVEYCLWITSCYWTGNSLSNPYYWFDFLLTATLVSFVPTLKKAVAA